MKLRIKKRGNFIQINFSSIPKRVENFSSSLKFDSNVLRFLVLNKINNVKKF
jgi:ribosomal protein S6